MAAKFQEKGDNRFGYMSETKFVDASEFTSEFISVFIYTRFWYLY